MSIVVSYNSVTFVVCLKYLLSAHLSSSFCGYKLLRCAHLTLPHVWILQNRCRPFLHRTHSTHNIWFTPAHNKKWLPSQGIFPGAGAIHRRSFVSVRLCLQTELWSSHLDRRNHVLTAWILLATRSSQLHCDSSWAKEYSPAPRAKFCGAE